MCWHERMRRSKAKRMRGFRTTMGFSVFFGLWSKRVFKGWGLGTEFQIHRVKIKLVPKPCQYRFKPEHQVQNL